jgi:regulator of nucleoside diphosphate kinase
MNSSVVYDDAADGAMATLTLVYPGEADIGMERVSVLSPLGLALIGTRPGQTVVFETPDGNLRRVRVISLVYQPEANGDWTR